jgi:glutamate/aspartate transport system substrate-binding protein
MIIAFRIAAAGLACSLFLLSARAEDVSPTLDKIKESGVVSFGYRDGFIPLSFSGGDGKPIGFGIDLCSVAAAKIRGAAERDDLKVEYKPVDVSGIAAALEEGRIDVACTAIPNAPEVLQQVSPTIAVYASDLRWIAPRRLRVEVESDWRRYVQIKTPTSGEDLRGQTVAVIRKPGAMAIALTLSNERTLGLSILEAKDHAEGLKLVEQGKAAAFLGDSLQLLALKAGSRNPDAFTFLDEAYPGEDYVFAVRKGDQAVKNIVDEALAEAMRSGEYARLYRQWFESPIPPRNLNLAFPMGERLKQLGSQAGAPVKSHASN